MARPFNVLRVTLDPVTWTAITVPFDCNIVSAENSVTTVAMTMRTDQADATTERPIPAATAHRIGAAGHGYRFQAGTVLYYLKVASGTGPAIVEFM